MFGYSDYGEASVWQEVIQRNRWGKRAVFLGRRHRKRGKRLKLL
jgi:hypothetical protein